MHFYEDDTSGRLYDVNSQEIKIRYKNWLRKTASLSKNSRFLCQRCLNIAIEKESGSEVLIQENSVESVQTEPENTTNSTTENDSSLVSEIIHLIRSNEINLKDKCSLARELGASIEKELYKETKTDIDKKRYAKHSEASESNTHTYLKDKNQILVQSLSNATMPKTKLSVNLRKNYNLCLVIEQILSLRNLNYIGSYSFAQSVVTWSLTGSRTAHSLQGMTSSSGSITTLQNFLK